MDREYFAVSLSAEIQIGLSLEDMTTVAQFDLKSICVIPGVDSFWYGVVNFQGSLLWVLDSDRFLNIESDKDYAKQQLTSIVLNRQLEGANKRVALVVKQLQGILNVESGKLQPIPNSLPDTLKNLCTATASKDERAIYLIDSAALLQKLNRQSSLVNI
jgi:twitching motility protein PilI